MNTPPRIACCNFVADADELRTFAQEHGFDGIEWSLRRADLPATPEEEERFKERILLLRPLEVRYHCAFQKTDLGDLDAERSREAMRVFRRVCRLVAGPGGGVVTIHVGLGHDSTLDLSWERTVDSLAHLVRYAESVGVRLCLENLAWVSPSVTSQHYGIEDFVGPQPERFLSGGTS